MDILGCVEEEIYQSCLEKLNPQEYQPAGFVDSLWKAVSPIVSDKSLLSSLNSVLIVPNIYMGCYRLVELVPLPLEDSVGNYRFVYNEGRLPRAWVFEALYRLYLENSAKYFYSRLLECCRKYNKESDFIFLDLPEEWFAAALPNLGAFNVVGDSLMGHKIACSAIPHPYNLQELIPGLKGYRLVKVEGLS